MVTFLDYDSTTLKNQDKLRLGLVVIQDNRFSKIKQIMRICGVMKDRFSFHRYPRIILRFPSFSTWFYVKASTEETYAYASFETCQMRSDIRVRMANLSEVFVYFQETNGGFEVIA